MTPTTDSQSARDDVFRRIGRNVVNFQYLEATLRMMIPMLFAKGTAKDLQAHHDETLRKYKKATLGKLADAYNKRVYASGPEDKAASVNVLSEPILTFGFHLGVSKEKATLWMCALADLIHERNRLIHEDLLNVEFSSREECEQLSARLDEQNTRVGRYLDHLNSVRTTSREMTEAFVELLQSEEYRDLIWGTNVTA